MRARHLAMSSNTTLHARARAQTGTCTTRPLHEVHSARSSVTVLCERPEAPPGSVLLAPRVQPVANGLVAPTPCSPGDLDRRIDEDRHIPFPKRYPAARVRIRPVKSGEPTQRRVPRRSEASQVNAAGDWPGGPAAVGAPPRPFPTESSGASPVRLRSCHISQKMFVPLSKPVRGRPRCSCKNATVRNWPDSCR